MADDRGYERVLLTLRRRIITRKTRHSLRSFKLPEMNFEAKRHIEVTNYAKVTVIEPPLTKLLNHNIITKCILNLNTIDDDISYLDKTIPSHNQVFLLTIRSLIVN